MKIDCIQVSEVNLAWQNVDYHDRLHEHSRGMFGCSKIIRANNRSDTTSINMRQSGGTMIIVNGEMYACVSNSQSDNRKIGSMVY